MDEILIEEKKYVSSKRAAKMTGYAKDYIGQLCREGRVPARLVGRSWYVLESAIQDHRFGTTDVQPKEAPVPWESPRYEAASTEVLPTVNRLKSDPVVQTEEKENVEEAPRSLQESWQAWFNDFDTNKASSEATAPTSEAPTQPVGAESVGEEEPYEEPKEEQIPIHTIYQLPPEELLPHRARIESVQDEREEVPYEPKPERARRGLSRGVVRTIQVASVVLALAMVSLATLGSGYLDSYIVSVSQVRIMAGVSLYNK